MRGAEGRPAREQVGPGDRIQRTTGAKGRSRGTRSPQRRLAAWGVAMTGWSGKRSVMGDAFPVVIGGRGGGRSRRGARPRVDSQVEVRSLCKPRHVPITPKCVPSRMPPWLRGGTMAVGPQAYRTSHCKPMEDDHAPSTYATYATPIDHSTHAGARRRAAPGSARAFRSKCCPRNRRGRRRAAYLPPVQRAAFGWQQHRERRAHHRHRDAHRPWCGDAICFRCRTELRAGPRRAGGADGGAFPGVRGAPVPWHAAPAAPDAAQVVIEPGDLRCISRCGGRLPEAGSHSLASDDETDGFRCIEVPSAGGEPCTR